MRVGCRLQLRQEIFLPTLQPTKMILRHSCLRIRTICPSIRQFAAAASKSSKPTSPNSIVAPSPLKSRPADNDPNYTHPSSIAKPGIAIKGVQILKDRPEILALPDDYYPDW